MNDRTMSEMTRSQQNEIIMKTVYNELLDFNFGDQNAIRDAREVVSGLCEMPIEEVDPYIMQSVSLCLQKYGEVVNAVTPYLKNWKWNRLPVLTQSILIMSYVHYYYVEKVDRKVVINTAVKLAKKYVDDKQAKFINAILDGKVIK